MKIFNLAEELEKERKKVKELKEELKSANESITWWSNRFNALEEENMYLRDKVEQLQDKIDSAINYIENNKWVSVKETLKILKGE